MPSRRTAATQIAAAFSWAVLVSIVALVLVYPALDRSTATVLGIRSPWSSVVAQVVAYALVVLPVFVLHPRVPLPFALSRTSGVVAVSLLALAILEAALVQQDTIAQGLRHAVTALSAGIGEELLFRGLIFERLRAISARATIRTAIGAALFAAFHLPVLIVQGGSPWLLVTTFAVGTLLSILRAGTRGLALPAAVHVAIDLSS